MDYQFEWGDVSRVYCEYLEIIPQQKISFLWAAAPCLVDYDIHMQAESRVTVYFTNQNGLTKIEIVHDRLSCEQAMQEYMSGWTSCMGKLEENLTQRISAEPAAPALAEPQAIANSIT